MAAVQYVRVDKIHVLVYLPSPYFHYIPSMFQEAHVFISAEKVEDVTEEKIRAELSKAHAHAPTQWVRRSSRSADKEEIVVSL